MIFKFDANQEFQIRAIESVTDLFEGQPRIETELEFALGGGFAAIPNRLDLDDDALLRNLQNVQTANGLIVDAELKFIEPNNQPSAISHQPFVNFSIEMETGTGKTYVYIRTALELFRRYGQRKFIVVVPSVAVREGVLKTLDITEKHLRELYGNTPYRYYAYDSDNLSQVRQFALSDGVEIMVMTIDSFNKASNVIRQTTDRLQGETPIHLVQATRPILILDEPQNMESELRVRALAALNPLFALRYSATHRNPYNLIYRLTPFEAYRQGLVKRIEVAGVVQEVDANRVFIRLDSVQAKKKTLTARLAVHKLMKTGAVKEQVVTVKAGDALEPKTNRPEYAAFVVEEINAGEKFVRFINGIELRVGEMQGADKRAIFDAQIRYTIEEHLRKQVRLRDHGIKVLSLFFIDRVDNYAREDGIIRQLFLKNFNQLKKDYPDWRRADPSALQAAYFAARKTKSGEMIYEDSKSGESEKDREAYDLIMRDKERLLSQDEPTCFIFSHSALREGWDSPNVFQICTLNQTASEMKKRQEIGRGVRLAVNQAGERVRDEKINVLTVVANESYEDYVARYQTELEEEFGGKDLPPEPANARKHGVQHLREKVIASEEFIKLWERIRHKTRYAVKVDSEKLIADVVAEIDQTEIHAPHLVIRKGRIDAETFEPIHVAEGRAPYEAITLPLPNIVELMLDLLERATPPVRLTRRTLLEIFKQSKNQDAALENPHEFAATAVRIVKDKLADQFIDGIRYTRISDLPGTASLPDEMKWYEMSQFKIEDEINLTKSIKTDKGLYDFIQIDTLAEKPEESIEAKFASALDAWDAVKLYVKLPKWFQVDTPIGPYIPDWAVVIEPRDEHGRPTGNERLYLVVETKGENWKLDLPPDQRRKIAYGARHFGSEQFQAEGALHGVDYKVVPNAKDLL